MNPSADPLHAHSAGNELDTGYEGLTIILSRAIFAGGIPIAHTLFRNLEDFLPSALDGLK